MASRTLFQLFMFTLSIIITKQTEARTLNETSNFAKNQKYSVNNTLVDKHINKTDVSDRNGTVPTRDVQERLYTSLESKHGIELRNRYIVEKVLNDEAKADNLKTEQPSKNGLKSNTTSLPNERTPLDKSKHFSNKEKYTEEYGQMNSINNDILEELALKTAIEKIKQELSETKFNLNDGSLQNTAKELLTHTKPVPRLKYLTTRHHNRNALTTQSMTENSLIAEVDDGIRKIEFIEKRNHKSPEKRDNDIYKSKKKLLTDKPIQRRDHLTTRYHNTNTFTTKSMTENSLIAEVDTGLRKIEHGEKRNQKSPEKLNNDLYKLQRPNEFKIASKHHKKLKYIDNKSHDALSLENEQHGLKHVADTAEPWVSKENNLEYTPKYTSKKKHLTDKPIHRREPFTTTQNNKNTLTRTTQPMTENSLMAEVDDGIRKIELIEKINHKSPEKLNNDFYKLQRPNEFKIASKHHNKLKYIDNKSHDALSLENEQHGLKHVADTAKGWVSKQNNLEYTPKYTSKQIHITDKPIQRRDHLTTRHHNTNTRTTQSMPETSNIAEVDDGIRKIELVEKINHKSPEKLNNDLYKLQRPNEFKIASKHDNKLKYIDNKSYDALSLENEQHGLKHVDDTAEGWVSKQINLENTPKYKYNYQTRKHHESNTTSLPNERTPKDKSKHFSNKEKHTEEYGQMNSINNDILEELALKTAIEKIKEELSETKFNLNDGSLQNTAKELLTHTKPVPRLKYLTTMRHNTKTFTTQSMTENSLIAEVDDGIRKIELIDKRNHKSPEKRDNNIYKSKKNLLTDKPIQRREHLTTRHHNTNTRTTQSMAENSKIAEVVNGIRKIEHREKRNHKSPEKLNNDLYKLQNPSEFKIASKRDNKLKYIDNKIHDALSLENEQHELKHVADTAEPWISKQNNLEYKPKYTSKQKHITDKPIQRREHLTTRHHNTNTRTTQSMAENSKIEQVVKGIRKIEKRNQKSPENRENDIHELQRPNEFKIASKHDNKLKYIDNKIHDALSLENEQHELKHVDDTAEGWVSKQNNLEYTPKYKYNYQTRKHHESNITSLPNERTPKDKSKHFSNKEKYTEEYGQMNSINNDILEELALKTAIEKIKQELSETKFNLNDGSLQNTAKELLTHTKPVSRLKYLTTRYHNTNSLTTQSMTENSLIAEVDDGIRKIELIDKRNHKSPEKRDNDIYKSKKKLLTDKPIQRRDHLTTRHHNTNTRTTQSMAENSKIAEVVNGIRKIEHREKRNHKSPEKLNNDLYKLQSPSEFKIASKHDDKLKYIDNKSHDALSLENEQHELKHVDDTAEGWVSKQNNLEYTPKYTSKKKHLTDKPIHRREPFTTTQNNKNTLTRTTQPMTENSLMAEVDDGIRKIELIEKRNHKSPEKLNNDIYKLQRPNEFKISSKHDNKLKYIDNKSHDALSLENEQHGLKHVDDTAEGWVSKQNNLEYTPKYKYNYQTRKHHESNTTSLPNERTPLDKSKHFSNKEKYTEEYGQMNSINNDILEELALKTAIEKIKQELSETQFNLNDGSLQNTAKELLTHTKPVPRLKYLTTWHRNRNALTTQSMTENSLIAEVDDGIRKIELIDKRNHKSPEKRGNDIYKSKKKLLTDKPIQRRDHLTTRHHNTNTRTTQSMAENSKIAEVVNGIRKIEHREKRNHKSPEKREIDIPNEFKIASKHDDKLKYMENKSHDALSLENEQHELKHVDDTSEGWVSKQINLEYTPKYKYNYQKRKHHDDLLKKGKQSNKTKQNSKIKRDLETYQDIDKLAERKAEGERILDSIDTWNPDELDTQTLEEPDAESRKEDKGIKLKHRPNKESDTMSLENGIYTLKKHRNVFQKDKVKVSKQETKLNKPKFSQNYQKKKYDNIANKHKHIGKPKYKPEEVISNINKRNHKNKLYFSTNRPTKIIREDERLSDSRDKKRNKFKVDEEYIRTVSKLVGRQAVTQSDEEATLDSSEEPFNQNKSFRLPFYISTTTLDTKEKDLKQAKKKSETNTLLDDLNTVLYGKKNLNVLNQSINRLVSSKLFDYITDNLAGKMLKKLQTKRRRNLQSEHQLKTTTEVKPDKIEQIDILFGKNDEMHVVLSRENITETEKNNSGDIETFYLE